MIESSLTAWALMLAFFLVSLLAGYSLSRSLPWSGSARQAGFPFAVAFALSPFLMGFSGVLVLGFLPEASHLEHGLSAFAALALCAGAACVLGRRQIVAHEKPSEPYGALHFIFAAVLGVWLLALLVNTLFLPLMQNDALEYATVGRILFEARTLEAYPVLNADATSSGFYGPWTHPPLYVGFIYLASVIQGHVNEPGLMRLIAPWFAVAVVYLTFALGSLINRFVGLLSALTCISAPLFFLGADAALIDALPVLGLALIITAVVGLQATPVVRGSLIGIALGLALWTHSQAILFVPLASAAVLLWYGELRWRALVLEGGSVLLWAIAIGGWPYYRNFMIFGSPISDNPAVFALPIQAWTDYFTIGRGLDNWAAIIQYGWFKGWFALEAFGVVFWLALPGLAYMLTGVRGNVLLNFGHSNSSLADFKALSRVMYGVWSIYFLGVVLSTLIGTELMIKNERYLLIMLPFISFVAGLGVAILLNEWPPLKDGRRFRRIFLGLAVFSFLSVCLVLTIYRFYLNGVTIRTFGQPFPTTMSARSEYLAVGYMRGMLPKDSLVFSLKPADMYYADRKMLSYLDSRLLKFYEANSLAAAARTLQDIGVTHVHLPDYGLPPLYNSYLQELLSRPDFAELLFSSEGAQVYRLRNAVLEEERPVAAHSTFDSRWQQMSALVLGGRKGAGMFSWSSEPYETGALSVGGLPWGGFHRDLTKLLVAGGGKDLKVIGGQEYLLAMATEGRGLVRVWLRQYDANDEPLRADIYRSTYTVRVGEYVLGDVYPQQRFARRVITLPETSRIEVAVEHLGTSRVRIQNVELVPVQ